MADRGVTGVAVEPLAKSLGATKGSFYWHFRDREDLVTAALELWEREGTEAVIATLGPVANGRDRLRQLLDALFTGQRRLADHSIALAADAGHPKVAEALARVNARRIAYVAEQLVATGVEAQEAERRALLAYTSYLGYSTLARSAPGTMPQGDSADEFVETMLTVLTAG